MKMVTSLFMLQDLDEEEKDKDIEEEIKELMAGKEIEPEEGIVGEDGATGGLDDEEEKAKDGGAEEEEP